jgi:hypothetical protein
MVVPAAMYRRSRKFMTVLFINVFSGDEAVHHDLNLFPEPCSTLLVAVKYTPPQVHHFLDQGMVILSPLLLVIYNSEDLTESTLRPLASQKADVSTSHGDAVRITLIPPARRLRVCNILWPVTTDVFRHGIRGVSGGRWFVSGFSSALLQV